MFCVCGMLSAVVTLAGVEERTGGLTSRGCDGIEVQSFPKALGRYCNFARKVVTSPLSLLL